MTSVKVTVNGLEFNGPEVAGATDWGLNITAGWDSPEADQDVLARLMPGSAMGRSMDRHRTIVCEGVVSASSDVEHWAAYRQLQALVPRHRDVPFVVDEPGGARMAYVRATPGSPRIRTHNGRMFEFQMTLLALEGTLAATTESSVSVPAYTAGVPVTNNGTALAPARVTAVGAGPVNVGGVVEGHWLFTSVDVPDGTVFDGAARTVRDGAGTDHFGKLNPSFEWLAIPPGTHTLVNGGPVPVTVTFRDTWL